MSLKNEPREPRPELQINAIVEVLNKHGVEYVKVNKQWAS